MQQFTHQVQLLGITLLLVLTGTGLFFFMKPSLSAYYRFRCESLYKAGNYEEAMLKCNKAGVWDATAEGYVKCAHIHEHHYNFKQAIVDYTKALELTPEESQGAMYANRGYAQYRDTQLFMRNDYELAIADFSTAIALDKTLVNVYGQRGWAYFREGAYEESIQDFTTILINDIEDHWTFYENRGLAYANQQKYQDAVADYTAFIEQYKLHDCQCKGLQQLSYVYLYRGYIHTIQKNYSQALKDFLMAINHNPALSHRYYVWGIASYTGQQDYALSAFTEQLQDDSDNIALLFGQAVVCEEIGCLNQAYRRYQQLLDVSEIPSPLRAFAQKRVNIMWETPHPFSRERREEVNVD